MVIKVIEYTLAHAFCSKFRLAIKLITAVIIAFRDPPLITQHNINNCRQNISKTK